MSDELVRDKVSRGTLDLIGHRLRFFGESRRHTALESPRGPAFLAAYQNVHHSSNAYYDGANWHRYDVARSAAVIVLTPDGQYLLYTVAAGANPITWGTIVPVGRAVLRLSYGVSTDVLNGAALAAGVYADVTGNQNFTVTSTTSMLHFAVRLAVSTTGALLASIGTRALIDSAGSPLSVVLGGGIHVASGYAVTGGGDFWLTGLAAGTHTIKLQVKSSQVATAFCRAGSAPGYEFAEIQVVESSP